MVKCSILNVSNKKLPANCAANHTMNYYVAMDTFSLLNLYKQREIFLYGNHQETRLQMKSDSWHAKPASEKMNRKKTGRKCFGVNVFCVEKPCVFFLLDFQPFLKLSLSSIYSFQKEKQLQVPFILKLLHSLQSPLKDVLIPTPARRLVLSVLQVHRESSGVWIHPSCPHRASGHGGSQWNRR